MVGIGEIQSPFNDLVIGGQAGFDQIDSAFADADRERISVRTFESTESVANKTEVIDDLQNDLISRRILLAHEVDTIAAIPELSALSDAIADAGQNEQWSSIWSVQKTVFVPTNAAFAEQCSPKVALQSVPKETLNEKYLADFSGMLSTRLWGFH